MNIKFPFVPPSVASGVLAAKGNTCKSRGVNNKKTGYTRESTSTRCSDWLLGFSTPTRAVLSTTLKVVKGRVSLLWLKRSLTMFSEIKTRKCSHSGRTITLLKFSWYNRLSLSTLRQSDSTLALIRRWLSLTTRCISLMSTHSSWRSFSRAGTTIRHTLPQMGSRRAQLQRRLEETCRPGQTRLAEACWGLPCFQDYDIL